MHKDMRIEEHWLIYIQHCPKMQIAQKICKFYNLMTIVIMNVNLNNNNNN